MERRGPYNKGRAGHARGASPYRIYQEHFKKWRGPLTGFMAAVLIFAVAPMVGQDGVASEVSVLSSSGTTAQIQADPVAAKKSVVALAHEIVEDCRTYGLEACVQDGEQLVQNVGTKTLSANEVVAALADFDGKYSSAVAQAACTFDFQNALTEMNNAQKKLSAFGAKYGSDFTVDSFADRSEDLANSLNAFEVFVKSCKSL